MTDTNSDSGLKMMEPQIDTKHSSDQGEPEKKRAKQADGSASPWMCPVCRAPLVLNSQQWQCENKHSYDKAKAGYVNLLLANQKSSQDPGDSKEMINARREFLESGYYFPLLEKLANLIGANCQLGALNIYDAGCGEGYYLGRLHPLLVQSGYKVSLAGHDISRPAIEKAAKKYSNGNFAIASSFEMPVVAGSQDILVQVFAPMKDSEVRRVLKPNGLWLRVSPGLKHLSQIKNAIYETPHDHVVSELVPDGFDVVEKSALKFSFELTQKEERKALLTMTPYYWRASEKEVAAIVDEVACFEAEFSIAVFRKRVN